MGVAVMGDYGLIFVVAKMNRHIKRKTLLTVN